MLLSSKKKLSQRKNKIASAKTPIISFSVFQATWVQKGKDDRRSPSSQCKALTCKFISTWPQTKKMSVWWHHIDRPSGLCLVQVLASVSVSWDTKYDPNLPMNIAYQVVFSRSSENQRWQLEPESEELESRTLREKQQALGKTSVLFPGILNRVWKIIWENYELLYIISCWHLIVFIINLTFLEYYKYWILKS